MSLFFFKCLNIILVKLKHLIACVPNTWLSTFYCCYLWSNCHAIFLLLACHHPSPWVMIGLLLMANFNGDFIALAGQNNSQVAKKCVWLVEIWEWRPQFSKSLTNFLKDFNSVNSWSVHWICRHSRINAMIRKNAKCWYQF